MNNLEHLEVQQAFKREFSKRSDLIARLNRSLLIKALLLDGMAISEVAKEVGVAETTVRTHAQHLKDQDERKKIFSELADKFARFGLLEYKPRMEDLGEVMQILARWKAEDVSRLVSDLRSGKLAQQYVDTTKTAAAIMPPDNSLPPEGQLYADRSDRKETAPAFIERVYGGAGWLTGEFTRADLRKLDPQAAMGLANWERSHGRASLNLPTVKERNDLLLADPHLSAAPAVTRLHDVQRARQRRAVQKTK